MIGHPMSEVIQVFGAYDKATDWKEGDVRRGSILIWTRVSDDKKLRRTCLKNTVQSTRVTFSQDNHTWKDRD